MLLPNSAFGLEVRMPLQMLQQKQANYILSVTVWAAGSQIAILQTEGSAGDP